MSVINALKNAAQKIGRFFSRLFEKDVVVKIVSLLSAIILWFAISVSEYPSITRKISYVPVQVSLEGTYAEANNFEVMSDLEGVTVWVELEGLRKEIGNLSAKDLVAVASADNVMYAGKYTLSLKIECPGGNEFEVTKIEPATVDVEFDRIITKEVPISPELSGITAGEGCVMDNEAVNVVPAAVNITGPAETVEQITSAAAVVSEDTALTGTTDFKTTALRLYSGTSVVADENAQLSYDKTEFTVHVPVYAKKTLKLDVRITNAPDSFDTERFKQQLVMSVDELEVAVPNENIKDNDTIEIGAIDMREVDIGSEFTFAAESFLPEGYLDWNEVGSVTVKCPSEGLVKRAVHITSIQLVNAPSQFDFQIITSGVTPTLIGTEESMEKLTYIDVTAQVDLLSGFDMEEGYKKLPITFSIPAYSDVWCVGSDGSLSPMATIKVTAKADNS